MKTDKEPPHEKIRGKIPGGENNFEFGLSVCLNFGMAKYISGEHSIQIKDGNVLRTYKTTGVGIGSNDGGKTYSVTLHDAVIDNTEVLDNLSCAKIDGYSIEPKQSAEEKAMVGAARIHERAVLDAAATVQDAIRQAEARINNAAHALNRSILDYLHTGKDSLDADEVLKEAGVQGTEDRTEAVACFQLDKLYGVDSPERGM